MSGGRIVRVGADEHVRAVAGPDTRVVDLRGQTVVPGFIDTHPHTFGRSGRSLRSPSLVGLRSVRAITEAVAREAAVTPAGEWIVTTPIGEPPDYFHLPESLDEQRWPTRTDLDAVAPRHPVYIPIGIWPYPVIFNSVALTRLGITASGPPDPRGVRIERDPASGEPTGLVRGMIFYNPSPMWRSLQGMLPSPSRSRSATRSAWPFRRMPLLGSRRSSSRTRLNRRIWHTIGPCERAGSCRAASCCRTASITGPPWVSSISG